MDNTISTAEKLTIFQPEDDIKAKDIENCLFLRTSDGEGLEINENVEAINEGLNIEISKNSIPSSYIDNIKYLSLGKVCEVKENTFKLINNLDNNISLSLDPELVEASKKTVIQDNAFGSEGGRFKNIRTIEGCSDNANLLLTTESFKYICGITNEKPSLLSLDIYLSGSWTIENLKTLISESDGKCKLFYNKGFECSVDKTKDTITNFKFERFDEKLKKIIEKQFKEENEEEKEEGEEEKVTYINFKDITESSHLKDNIFKKLMEMFGAENIRINIKPSEIDFINNKEIKYGGDIQVSFNGDLIETLKKLCKSSDIEGLGPDERLENKTENRNNIKEFARNKIKEMKLDDIKNDEDIKDLINYYPGGNIRPLDLIKKLKKVDDLINIKENENTNRNKIENLFKANKFLGRNKDAKIKQWIYNELCTEKGRLRLAAREIKNNIFQLSKMIDSHSVLGKEARKARNLISDLKDILAKIKTLKEHNRV